MGDRVRTVTEVTLPELMAVLLSASDYAGCRGRLSAGHFWGERFVAVAMASLIWPPRSAM
jgi:hypothetical protein